MKLPTEPAQAVLLAIYDHIAQHGSSPFTKELTTETRSLDAVQWHIAGLRKAGLITRTRRHGSIDLTHEGHRLVAVLRGWDRSNTQGGNDAR